MSEKTQETVGKEQKKGIDTTSTAESSKPLTKIDDLTEFYDEEELEDTQCGIGSFKPKWLQPLATKEMYLLVFYISGLVQGMFFTYSVSVISTVEKRFKLTSKQLGILLCGNDISQVLLAMFLGYYGNLGHRPRWLGIGVMFSAASCFMAALPHLVYGPGRDAIMVAKAATVGNSGGILGNLSQVTDSKHDEELCHIRPENQCGVEEEGHGFIGSIIMLFVAQFFVGISVSIMFSLGVTYMDDNINKKTYPMYYAMMMLLRVLGPVMGFIIGGKCLSVWIDPSIKPNISKEDPRWLGAWWLGFLYLGFGLLLTGGFFFLFPRKMPATLRRETKRMMKKAEKEQKEGGTRELEDFMNIAKTKTEQTKPTLENLKKALKRIFTNEIWVGNLFNTTLVLLAVAGYYSFKPKYLENQFRKSATEANYFTGLASLITSVVGALSGGLAMRYFRPGPRVVTGYNIFLTLAGSAGFVALMFVSCPKLDVVGPVEGAMVPACSQDCGCSERYTPVCAEDGKTLFYSPCFAGCTVANKSAVPIQYSNCKCIGNSTQIPVPYSPSHHDYTSSPLLQQGPMAVNQETFWGTVTRGYCPEPCAGFLQYFIIQTVANTLSSTGRVTSSVLHLRSVDDVDKGLALGTMTVFISLFGFIPAPIIMGAIIDSACRVWDTTCGIDGNCWLYDSDKFRLYIHLFPAILVFISVAGDIVMFRYAGRLDLYGDKDDDLEMFQTKKDKNKNKNEKRENEEQEDEAKEQLRPLNGTHDEHHKIDISS